jgi:hypothetical protein
MPAETLRPASGPAVWYGPAIAQQSDWLHQLLPDQIDALEAAATRLLRDGRDIASVTRSDAALAMLDPTLERIAGEVLGGRGFVLLRGLPMDRWDRATSAMVYWIIGTRLGIAVPQNAGGHLLGHVRDLGHDPADPMTRIYTTNARQEFHTDSCDIVGLLCLHPSRSGGASAIASSTTIWNEVLARRPDLARVLIEPFTVDRKGEVPPGKQATYELPIFHDHAGTITGIYARAFIEAAQTRSGVPRLSPQQVEAMDLVDHLANDNDIRLDMDFQPGDIQFLHNHQILHARTPYQDWPKPERKRHLLRLWLSAHQGRDLPTGFAERYGTVEKGKVRGGIRVEGVKPSAPLEP